MTPELWHVLFVVFAALGTPFLTLVVWDVHRYRAGKPTISHAFFVLGRTYQAAAPLLSASAIGLVTGLIVHFWGP